MTAEVCCKFPSKDTFVALNRDSLKAWNVKSGECNLHLLAKDRHTSFTCLSWKLKSLRAENKERRSGKTKITNYVTVGTTDGDILLFNEEGKEISNFSGGHSDAVNCISWTKEDIFYSCASDKHIVEWDSNALTHKWKWKAHVTPIVSISLEPISKTLFSAGKVIKIWDLENKQLLKKLSGHSFPVYSLSIFNIGSSASSAKKTLQKVDGINVLSASFEETSLKFWQLDGTKGKKRSTSISLPSPPKHIEAIHLKTQDNLMKFVVLTNDEQVLLFSHHLNGTENVSSTPFKTIKLLTESATPLKIICASFKKKSNSLVIAYGSTSKAAFQTINNKVDKKKLSSSDKPTKAKRKSRGVAEKLQEDEEMDPDHIESHQLEPPNADVFNFPANKIIPQVFEQIDETLIKDTIQSLNGEDLSQFVEQLSTKLEGNSTECMISLRWLKEILKQQPSAMAPFQESSIVWKRFDRLKEVQLQLQSSLPRLQGRLDLIMNQIIQRKDGCSSDEDAALIYEDESSEDEMEVFTYSSSDTLNEDGGNDDVSLSGDEEENLPMEED